MSASIIIRTYNEECYLSRLLKAIFSQKINGLQYEVIVVDSGSTDKTIEIANANSCRVVYISKEEFTFGRSLNLGCKIAKGDYLVFISGHCIPINNDWLMNLLTPLMRRTVVLTYGRQTSDKSSKFSESQVFKKYFANTSRIPQEGFFCSNANLALNKSVWLKYYFNEDLTGLEDLYIAKNIVNAGMRIGYVAGACIYHCHNETWSQVKRRYEREAIALQYIMPEIHISFLDFLRYFMSSVFYDIGEAMQQKIVTKKIHEIILFRFMQYWGTFQGNHDHKKLSKIRKEKYFYPK